MGHLTARTIDDSRNACNAARFKQIVHAIARHVGALLNAVHEPSITPNFFAADMTLREQQITLLCSRNGMWACTQTQGRSGASLRFVDCPALAAALREQFGIDPLAAVELDGPFRALPGMSGADIQYWRPQTLGEGVFNWWD
jgi:hypothetical protein